MFALAEREKNNELITLGTLPGNFVPQTLVPLYGRTDPQGAMASIRLKVE